MAAVVAGKDELKQAAKRVRELKRKPREEAPNEHSAATEAAAGTSDGAVDELQELRHRVAELTAENAALRQQLAQLQSTDGQPF